ncbi:MAG TPA: UDP-N-acetylmuramate dehydrogenase [Candidatus Ventrisoma faecale]|nr:UDP-N-acetylmuramate dehydrogenase [Candidatus Ventrisoma faecale]
MSEFEEKLRKIVNEGELWVNEPMSAHTTFRIGGPADFLVTPGTAGQLKEILALCREENQPFFILGNGSNLLVGDRGYSGTMICLSRLSAVETEGTLIKAQAGALLSKIAREACERSLAGFEFAAGIPGSLGGAVVMNAGAYGGELKDVLVNVTVMDREGNILKKTPEELCMGYRTSSVLSEEYVVLEAEINLEKGDRRLIRARMDDLAARRREKQPLEYPSAGSTFKRPEGYFAGKLIDDAGLRGFRVGGAQVAEKHCGFVINREQATAADVMELCRRVSGAVKEQFGVELEMEVKTIGNF